MINATEIPEVKSFLESIKSQTEDFRELEESEIALSDAIERYKKAYRKVFREPLEVILVRK